MSVLALIPARSGSKSCPGKNLRTLGGKTLIQHAIECAQAVEDIGTTLISTDIPAGPILSAYTAVPHAVSMVLRRPPELAQDSTPMIDVVTHALAQIPGPDDQIVVLLQPTQPFRTPEHVTAAIALLQETQADSVVSVVELPRTHHPRFVLEVSLSGLLEPHELMREAGYYTLDGVPARRQNVDPVFIRDGTCYAFWRKTVSRHGTIYGQDVRPLIIPPDESCELDTEDDWREVERRWKERA